MADLSIEDLIRAEEEALTRAREAREAAAVSPEALALSQRAKLASLKAAREAEERALVDDRAWLNAVAEHGEQRVKRIHTAKGDIIIRANTSTEWDAIQARVESLTTAALEANDPARASVDALRAYREGLLTKSLIHPQIAVAREIAAAYPQLWGDLYAARDSLNRGPIGAAGKGDAR